MDDRDPSPDDVSTCPNCAGPVVYRGVGRRPVWCSARSRNDAALQRLGARKGAIEVRLVEVSRGPTGVRPQLPDPVTTSSNPSPSAGEERTGDAPSVDQALRTIRNDPEAVGRLLTHLERRRADGTLSNPEWLPVRNALRLVTRELTPEMEWPTNPTPRSPNRPPLEGGPPNRS